MTYTQTVTSLGTIDADEATSAVAVPADSPEAIVLVSSTSVSTGATIALECRWKDPLGAAGSWKPILSIAITANGAKAIPLSELPELARQPDEIRLNAGTDWTDGTHVFSLITTATP